MHPSHGNYASSRSPQHQKMPRGSAVTYLGRYADQALRLRRQARAKLALSLAFWPLLQAGSEFNCAIRRRLPLGRANRHSAHAQCGEFLAVCWSPWNLPGSWLLGAHLAYLSTPTKLPPKWEASGRRGCIRSSVDRYSGMFWPRQQV
jgi:hypothetical protein